jgi:SAM-dependent methyltransferase
MTERQLIGQRAQEFCDDLWQRGDFWNFEGSEYERARCECLMAILDGYRYARALEIGCGAGYFTRLLTRLADQVVAFDIAPAAIARARILGADLSTVDFRVANAMDYEWRAEGLWDLVVFSDTICYLGWLYSFFDVSWMAVQLFEATRPGGQLLLANSMDEGEDWLLRPWIIRTYRDLCVNVGYEVTAEHIFKGTKKGVDFEVLVTLFSKPPGDAVLSPES